MSYTTTLENTRTNGYTNIEQSPFPPTDLPKNFSAEKLSALSNAIQNVFQGHNIESPPPKIELASHTPVKSTKAEKSSFEQLIGKMITIRNPINGRTWRTFITIDEYSEFNACRTSKATVSLGLATLRPVRTNTWNNFARDFFLPTVLHHVVRNQARKVQNVFFKILAGLGAASLDLLTLPIRFVTAIPRAIENAGREQHPFLTFFKRKNIDLNVLTADRIEISTGQQDPYTCLNLIEVPENC